MLGDILKLNEIHANLLLNSDSLDDDDYGDLFSGSGGTSTALLEVTEELGKKARLVAVNHWSIAIATHSANHPNAIHYNSDLRDVDPRQVVPSGRLRLFVANPECTHFSRARGGKPMNKQSRASVKYVLRWIRALDIEDVLIENVPDFLSWGPLDPATMLPVKKRKGEYFHRFVRKLQHNGYTVDWRVLNAADYGDPQTRKRLFIIARKNKAIVWPEQTHHRNGGDMFGPMPKWRPARDIIDWDNKGKSIFKREKPLRPNTMRRILAGLHKFGLKPFVIGQQSGAIPREVGEPIPTIATAGKIALIEPYIIQMDQGGVLCDINKPLPTITSADAWALVEPYIVPLNHGDDMRTLDIDKPLPTITSVDAWGLIQPYLVLLNGTSDRHLKSSIRSVDEPIPTLTGTQHVGLCEPYLVEYHGDADGKPRVRSVDDPLPTIDTNNRIALAEPYLIEYYGTGQSFSVDEPLKTLTGRDRFGLAWPMVLERDGKRYLLDILYRMLTPRELARGMSFPDWYEFKGNREQVVKQIGNSVCRRQAKALIRSLLTS